MSNRIAGLLVATIALTGILVTSAPADAALLAYLCDDAACAGGNDHIISDQGIGDQFPGSALVGQINSGAVNFAGFSIMTNVTQSKPLIGSAGSPQLDLNFTATTTDQNPAGTVWLYATDTDFTGGGDFAFTFGGTQPLIGDLGNSVQGRAWGGANNVNTGDPRAAGPLFANTGLLIGTPFNATDLGVFNPAVNPFALTIGVQITRATPGTTTGNLHLSVVPVPEPATMGLFGLGMIGASWYRRRKGNQTR